MAADLDPPTRPGRAFSNGTEYEIWADRWCDRCTVEDDFRAGTDDIGCPLIIVALCTDDTPAAWMPTEPGSPDSYECIDFRGRDHGPEPEPKPLPEPPDMDGLFDRPDGRVRMLVQPEQSMAVTW